MHKHLRHTPVDEMKWFKCSECEYKAKQAGDLRKHQLYRHTPGDEIEWFQCDKCEYKAKQKVILKFHVSMKHTSPNEKRYGSSVVNVNIKLKKQDL
jgi:hypothetical protein